MDLVEINLDPFIEEDHRCFVLGGYFVAAVLVSASYSRQGFSPFRAGSTRCVMVPGGSMFHLEPGTILSHTPLEYKTDLLT